MPDPLVVKICGIKTPERSPRHVGLETLQELISKARGRVETCVVLVNPDNSTVMEVAALSPDWIQLHGPETPHRVEAIRDEAGIAILKALSIGTAEDVAHVADFVEAADRILLDAKPPKGADRPGGRGVSFDWGLLKALDPSVPFMLSGGLTPATVGEAIRAVRPMGVDVSSGVETAPGVKDAALIRAFIDSARAAHP